MGIGSLKNSSFPKEEMKKGSWTAMEDEILTQYIKTHGEGKWSSVSKKSGIRRSGKSCRLRWLNYLRPDIKRGNFNSDEDDLILRLHNLLGNRWSLIAGRLPGRTDSEIKNYWNSKLSKRAQSEQLKSFKTRPKKRATLTSTNDDLSQSEFRQPETHVTDSCTLDMQTVDQEKRPYSIVDDLKFEDTEIFPDLKIDFNIRNDASISEFLESDFSNLKDFVITREHEDNYVNGTDNDQLLPSSGSGQSISAPESKVSDYDCSISDPSFQYWLSLIDEWMT